MDQHLFQGNGEEAKMEGGGAGGADVLVRPLGELDNSGQ